MTENFEYYEVTNSPTAIRLGISNEMDDEEYDRMETLLTNVLEPARKELGSSICILEGFKAPGLAKIEGHLLSDPALRGESVVITAPGENIKLWKILEELPFDELIWGMNSEKEPEFIIVSHKEINRGIKKRMNIGDHGRVFYTKLT